jgi:hypothetical protein
MPLSPNLVFEDKFLYIQEYTWLRAISFHTNKTFVFLQQRLVVNWYVTDG